MPAENPIFRKVALDRLSSPEQLDRLMQVTSTRGWLALLTIGFALLLGLLWGIFGSIHTRVSGQGILIKGGNLYDVVSVGSGVVTRILVRAGATLETNTLVAVIGQPELELRITNTLSLLQRLESQHQELLLTEERSLLIETNSMRQEFTNLFTSVAKYGELVQKLREKQVRQQEAQESGLIVPAVLLATDIEIFSAEQDKARANQRLRQIEAAEINRPTEIKQQRQARAQRIEETKHALRLLEQQLQLSSEVRSPYAGKVLEVVVDRGNFITSGARILSLETEERLQAVLFTPPEQGKRIKPGYEVQLSPATVKREEAGFIKGRVEFVSEFPATPERMMRVLRNRELVEHLSGTGAPIEVLVHLLQREDGTYHWSSPREDPGRIPVITSGTLCNASVVVRTNRPISLVLPILKEASGM